MTDKFEWMRAVTAVPNLTAVEFYALLEVFNKGDGAGRHAYVSARSVAEKSGKSERRVQGALRELVDRGLIRRVARGGRAGGRRLASEYALGDPREFAPIADDADVADALITGQRRPVGDGGPPDVDVRLDAATTGHSRPVDSGEDADDHRTIPVRPPDILCGPPDAGVGPSNPYPTDPLSSNPERAASSLRYVPREDVDVDDTPLAERAPIGSGRLIDPVDFDAVLSDHGRRQLAALSRAEQCQALDAFRQANTDGVRYRDQPQRLHTVDWSQLIFDVYLATITERRADDHEFADVVATAIVAASRASRIETVAERILTRLHVDGTATKTTFRGMYPSNQAFADGTRGRDLVEPALAYLVDAGLIHLDGRRYSAVERIGELQEVTSGDR